MTMRASLDFVAPLTRRGLVLGLGLAALGGARAATPVRHETTTLFGGAVDLLLPARTREAVVDDALFGLRERHRRWNAWKPGDASALNRAFRDERSAPATPALIALIDRARELEVASGGHFNAAIGAWVGAWGFHTDVLDARAAPSPAERSRWRRPSLASVRSDGRRVWSTDAAVQLDFGAIGKGAAADALLDGLRRRGVHDALVNLGGNLAAMGHAAGRPWRVGIRDPQGPGLVATLELAGREAVITSGTYERWRRAGTQIATHVIDPGSGDALPTLASATVVHADAALADAAATALLVAGPARWRAVAQRMGVAQALVIDHAGRREATLPLARRLQPAPG